MSERKVCVYREGFAPAEHAGDCRVTEGGALLIVQPQANGTTRVVAGYAPHAWTRVVVSEP